VFHHSQGPVVLVSVPMVEYRSRLDRSSIAYIAAEVSMPLSRDEKCFMRGDCRGGMQGSGWRPEPLPLLPYLSNFWGCLLPATLAAPGHFKELRSYVRFTYISRPPRVTTAHIWFRRLTLKRPQFVSSSMWKIFEPSLFAHLQV
jgi:hypothetical protein